ncbi:ABC transporter substrate-binding protein [Paenibacillus sp. strain BS8-2]
MPLRRFVISLLSLCTVITLLSGCGNSQSASENATRTIEYLGQMYTIPAEPQRILFMSAFESMEDAVVLNYEPYASSAIGDDAEPFPGFYGTVMKETIPLMGATEESLEYLLELAPDLIIGTDMETEAVHEKLALIAPYIPVSHFGQDWQANLEMLADVTGQQTSAVEAVANYEKAKKEAQSIVSQLDSTTEVLAVRVRGGEIMVYPQDVFVNSVLYEELGFTVPSVVAQTTQQTAITLEGLFAANPDYLIVQYDIYENGGSEQTLQDIQASKVWQSLDAVKQNKLFINAIDPLVSGGSTAYGKIRIVEAVLEQFQ